MPSRRGRPSGSNRLRRNVVAKSIPTRMAGGGVPAGPIQRSSVARMSASRKATIGPSTAAAAIIKNCAQRDKSCTTCVQPKSEILTFLANSVQIVDRRRLAPFLLNQNPARFPAPLGQVSVAIFRSAQRAGQTSASDEVLAVRGQTRMIPEFSPVHGELGGLLGE